MFGKMQDLGKDRGQCCPFTRVFQSRWFLAYVIGLAAFLAIISAAQAQPQPAASTTGPTSDLKLEPAPVSIWENGVGEGFRSSAESLTVGAGGVYGIAAFGSREAHDLAFGSVTYGHMLGRTRGEGHWYRGNFEFRAELFAGAEFAPHEDWFVGLTPHLRYDFATGTRWVPFVDLGAGVTATSIGPPDLSGTFEFNLNAGGGVLWFIKDNIAIDIEAKYVHWSCAGIHKPNLGLNGFGGMAGISFFF